MHIPLSPSCRDCDNVSFDRRGFMKAVGTGAAILGAGSFAPYVFADPEPAPENHVARPAETLVQELYATLTDEQKRTLVYPWNHVSNGSMIPTRLRMYNSPFGRTIGDAYTAPQQRQVEQILRGIAAGEEGYRLLSRNNSFDNPRAMLGCGAYIFGDPSGGHQFSWVFAGHHITVRCDGNSEAGTAFGGPMYYGHLADGLSQRNVFNYQTRSVVGVHAALSEAERTQAVIVGSPGELEPSIRFRANGAYPGIAAADLSADKRRLVETVMHDVLSPYRQEDADEVMDIVRRNGGMERIHLAFYRDQGQTNTDWHFWRLEGPGFVWNYRVLPHVHTYVHVATV